MNLRSWIKRLERDAAADTRVIVCPECGEEFRVHQDASLDYLAYGWRRETGGKSYRETPADVLRLVAHAHDASVFVDKEDGSAWLGQFFHGIEQDPHDVEDLSEP